MTSSAAPFLPRRTTLADRFIAPAAESTRARSLAVDAALVVGGTALTAALAQVEVPLWPVPITGQTLAVLLVGSALGARRGALSMVLYAVLGVIGLPIFSDASHGLAVLASPTGGYIIGFIFAAYFTGWVAQRTWDRRFVGAMVSFIAGSAVTFVFGLPWLSFTLHLNVEQTLQAGLYPFVLGGVIKAVIAALAIRGGWWVSEWMRSHR